MFYEKFTVRWSDIDANKHLANASYMNYCSQTRMSFLHQHKIGIFQLGKWNIGPVVMKEEFLFYKEIFAHNTVFVGLELKGKSEDGSLFHIQHKLYNEKGEHCATSHVFGAWLDLTERKITTPPLELFQAFEQVNSENCDTLTINDIKKGGEKPQNIDPSLFSK